MPELPQAQNAPQGAELSAPAGLTLGVAETTDIVGLKVSTAMFCDNAQAIERAALAGQGGWVLTLNLEMIARLATDPTYFTALRDVDLIVADGIPVVWLSRTRAATKVIPSRTCGVDLTAHFLRHFPGRMGVLGGTAPQLALKQAGTDPARVVYQEAGEVTMDRIGAIAAAVNASKCQLLFVALGVPKQDYFCQALRKLCPEVVCIGVGGSLEILAGLIPRAPEWLQNLGLEWLYRLWNEPRRLWRRYLLHYPRAVPRILRWAGNTKGRKS